MKRPDAQRIQTSKGINNRERANGCAGLIKRVFE
jgi:hypothetical protein